MSAGGDLERPLGALLALDVGEVERRARSLCADAGLRPHQYPRCP